jgi:hypothetical protein
VFRLGFPLSWEMRISALLVVALVAGTAEAQTRYCFERIKVGSKCADRLTSGVANDIEKNTWCVEGAFCDLASGLCAAKPGINKRCGNDIVCAARLGCSTNEGGPNALCRALPSLGQPCLFSDRGEQSSCGAGLGCYDNKCQSFASSNGGSCTTDRRCAPGFACSWSNAAAKDVCTAYKMRDQACEQGQCTPNLVCSSGKCAAKKSSGSCSIDQECTDDRYCYNRWLIIFGRSCLGLPKIGQACTARCPSNLVCRLRVARI